MSAVFSQDSPKSHERIGFSIAIKNMHPLEVIPIDGSGPSSPTFENLKSISIGGRESSFPYLSVTQIRWSSITTSGSSSTSGSLPIQPDKNAVVMSSDNSTGIRRILTAKHGPAKNPPFTKSKDTL